MPAERRPLFNQRLLADRLAGFAVPDLDAAKLPVIRRWRTALDRGRLGKAQSALDRVL